MAYTVKQVATMSKISVRTLHFYNESGLLKPPYYNDAGYRFYEEPQPGANDSTTFKRCMRIPPKSNLGVELRLCSFSAFLWLRQPPHRPKSLFRRRRRSACPRDHPSTEESCRARH